MEHNVYIKKQDIQLSHQEGAARNERFVEKCLKQINAAPDAEEGLHRMLQYLGEALQCDRVYVFEEMDRQHIRNTYEWCRPGVFSGIKQLPYLAKKDLFPWYGRLKNGENIIESNVEPLQHSDPLIYEFLEAQQIHSIVLSPLLAQGRIIGLLGADNPPPGKLAHLSVLFDVLAYFVLSLINQRELSRLRRERMSGPSSKAAVPPRYMGRTVLLVDDSPELIRLNERVLRPEGYRLLSAGTLREAEMVLAKTTPDAIVLDIDLPDGNGIAFCRELRSRVPVVFLTARSDEQTAKEGLRAGGCAFLTKPYQLEELRNAVAKAVGCTGSGAAKDALN